MLCSLHVSISNSLPSAKKKTQCVHAYVYNIMTSLLIYHDIILIPVACTTSRNLTVVYMPCFKSNPTIAHTGGNGLIGA